jgi:SpoVK/Ycf46/Vps4 family AAA+-type ATPase
MDDATLAELGRAFLASPGNMQLLSVLCGAHLERGEIQAAKKLVDRADLSGELDREAKRIVARVFLESGDAERVLSLADSADGATLLLRAKALLALDRQSEAQEAYRAAVRENPTLEDTDLEARLGARVREIGVEVGRPRLKVISNDDTDESEVSRLLRPEPEVVRFGDVGGLDEVKKQIERRIILPFKKPSLFQRFKKRVGGGILLYGPPGCGKTLLARATAGECQAKFFNIAISDVLDMYIGESERKLHALFEKARSSAPAVVFFDELEALAGKRQYTREAASSKIVSQFLSEMDGFAQNNHGVLILGATNVPWAIDPAFRRPGRFDRMMFIPPPDEVARRAILEKLLSERPVEPGIDVAALCKRASGFSGADLRNMVEFASDEAVERSLSEGREAPIQMKDLKHAQGEVRPTTLEWLSTARNYARYANEAGHYDEVLAFLAKHGKTS